MATNIPPHNLREAIDAVIAHIDDPSIDVNGLMKHLKGPDFPTGGMIVGHGGIRDAYETGRGRVVIRGRAHIEPLRQGKEAIIVTEMPYQVYKGDGRGDGGGLMQKIVEQVQNGRLKEISDLRDESDQSGIRLVIELKRDAIPKVVLNKLYKHTSLQTTFGVNMVALVDGVPRTLGLLPIVRNYVDHQRDVIVRRTKYELAEREARLHILEGLLIAIANIDEVIELIRGSRDPDTAREGLIERFELSRIQAQAILDLRLQRLTALQTDEIKTEHADVVERIRELRDILGDEARVMGIIKEELTEIRERYGDERRTEITHSEDEIDIEDLIADQQMVISITHSGYIKTLPLATYRQQRRGGLGVMGMEMKDEDWIEHLFVSSTHDYLLFFTNRGKVYRQKVYELPEASRTAKGRALVNLLPLREGERVQAVLATRDFKEGKYLVFATRKGQIKKTEFRAYNTPIKADGIIAINIRDDDELVAVRRTGGDDDIIMVSRSGQAARFNEDQVRSMGRDTAGVRGMNVSRGDNRVLAMDVVRPDTELLVVTENGYGKRTAIEEYPVKGRGVDGREDDQPHREEGRARGRADRARALRPRLHLPERHGPAHRGQGHLQAGPPGTGRARDEPARGRRGERGGPGDGDLRARHRRASAGGGRAERGRRGAGGPRMARRPRTRRRSAGDRPRGRDDGRRPSRPSLAACTPERTRGAPVGRPSQFAAGLSRSRVLRPEEPLPVLVSTGGVSGGTPLNGAQHRSSGRTPPGSQEFCQSTFGPPPFPGEPH